MQGNMQNNMCNIQNNPNNPYSNFSIIPPSNISNSISNYDSPPIDIADSARSACSIEGETPLGIKRYEASFEKVDKETNLLYRITLYELDCKLYIYVNQVNSIPKVEFERVYELKEIQQLSDQFLSFHSVCSLLRKFLIKFLKQNEKPKGEKSPELFSIKIEHEDSSPNINKQIFKMILTFPWLFKEDNDEEEEKVIFELKIKHKGEEILDDLCMEMNVLNKKLTDLMQSGILTEQINKIKNELNASIQQIKTKVDQIKTEGDNLTKSQNEKILPSITNIQNDNKAIRQEIKTLKDSMPQTIGNNIKTNPDFVNLTKAVEELKQKTNTQNNTINNLNAELNKTKTDLKNASTANTNAVNGLTAKVNQLAEELKGVKTEKDALKGEVGNLKNQINQINAELAKIKAENANIANSKKEITDTKNEVANIKKEKDALKNDIAAKTGQINQINTNIANLTKTVNDAKGQTLAEVNKVKEETKGIKGNRDLITALQKEKDAIKAELAAAKKEITDHKAASAVKNDINNCKAEIMKEIGNVRNEIKTVRAEKDAVKKTVDDGFKADRATIEALKKEKDVIKNDIPAKVNALKTELMTEINKRHPAPAPAAQPAPAKK